MKVAICLALFCAVVLAGPAVPARHVVLEEFDVEFKRFIPVENSEGAIEVVDLLEGELSPFVSTSDVSYDFYSKSTQNSPITITSNNVGALDNTKFDLQKPIVFVSHGWNNNRNSAVNTKVRETAFVSNDINLFIVDWSGPANKNYISAKAATVQVGAIIGAFINSIQTKYGIDGSNFILVGHSLGAHVAGNAGAAVNKQVKHIVGLDPAGPLYSLSQTNNRLDPSDGQFVEVIHTNGALLGMASSIGDADYYPNGGRTQPGCGLDLTGSCAHSKAYLYFSEALARGKVFQGVLCSSYSIFESGSCAANRRSPMADITLQQRYSGDFYLKTNANAPFGQS